MSIALLRPAPRPAACAVWSLDPDLTAGFLGPLISVLSEAHQAMNGDLAKFLILLVVAMRSAEHPAFRALSHEQIMAGEIRELPTRGTNVGSVAASLRMPKETVRRKTHELVAAGWVAIEHHKLRITCAAYRDLVPLRLSLQRMAEQHHDLVAAARASARA